jgi:dienelactone hydrolase
MRLVDDLISRSSARDPMFVDGWGEPGLLGDVEANRLSFVAASAPAQLSFKVSPSHPRWSVQDFSFESPLAGRFAEPQCARVSGRWLRPVGPASRRRLLVLGSSREEGFALRTWSWSGLLGQGYELVFLETPFYGVRRTRAQTSASVRSVSEQLLLHVSMVQEAGAMLNTMRQGFSGSLGVAGFSMGGYMAAMTAALAPFDLAAVIIAGGVSPVPVYLDHYLARSVSWSSLSPSPSAARARLRRLLSRDASTYAPPQRPDAAAIIACARDGFVPPVESARLAGHWGTSDLSFVDAGHTLGFLAHRPQFHAATERAFDRLTA